MGGNEENQVEFKKREDYLNLEGAKNVYSTPPPPKKKTCLEVFVTCIPSSVYACYMCSLSVYMHVHVIM